MEAAESFRCRGLPRCTHSLLFPAAWRFLQIVLAFLWTVPVCRCSHFRGGWIGKRSPPCRFTSPPYVANCTRPSGPSATDRPLSRSRADRACVGGVPSSDILCWQRHGAASPAPERRLRAGSLGPSAAVGTETELGPGRSSVAGGLSPRPCTHRGLRSRSAACKLAGKAAACYACSGSPCPRPATLCCSPAALD